MTGCRERSTFVLGTCSMLRGWKSASCNGFPALSGATVEDLIEVLGSPPAKKSIPMLSNHRLRPIPVMKSSSVTKSRRMDSFFHSNSSISFTFACQSGINLRVQSALKANANVHDDASLEQIEPAKADSMMVNWKMGVLVGALAGTAFTLLSYPRPLPLPTIPQQSYATNI